MSSSRLWILVNLPTFFLIIVILDNVTARPEASQWRCDDDSTKREICQRCAKQTKSPIVYPMCCNEEDEVHNWCFRYTNFGKVA